MLLDGAPADMFDVASNPEFMLRHGGRRFLIPRPNRDRRGLQSLLRVVSRYLPAAH